MFIRHWDQQSVMNNILHLHAIGEELSSKYIQTEHKDLYMAAVKCLGGWGRAIASAGLDYESIRKRKAWDKGKIIEEIRKAYEKGEDLSCSRMQREYSDLEAAVYLRFGNWGNAITTSGLDYEEIRRYRAWDKAKIVEGIKEAYAKGEDLSWRNFSQGKYCALAHAAIRKSGFGSWGSALEAAGLDYDKIRRYQHWDKKKVKAEIGKLFWKDIELNSKNVQKVYPALYAAAGNRFNSWREAIESVSLDYCRIAKRRKWSKEEVINELLALKQKGERLSDPRMRKEYPSLHSAALKFFGCWTKARQSIGDYTNYRRKWTRETIIEEIQKLHERGIPLTKKYMLKNKRIGLCCASRSKNNFGSWIKAKEIALSQIPEAEKVSVATTSLTRPPQISPESAFPKPT